MGLDDMLKGQIRERAPTSRQPPTDVSAAEADDHARLLSLSPLALSVVEAA
jgi:hypothetical protein